MKMRNKWMWACAAMLLSHQAQTQVQAQGIAFVSDLKGEVTIDAAKAGLMSELKKGGRVVCAKECTVGVMYLQSGKEFTLKGPGDFLVGDAEVTTKIGAPPTQRATQWKVAAQTVTQVAQTANASIRMRSVGGKKTAEALQPPAQRLLYPTQTKVASLQPAFRWAVTDAKAPYEFELKATGESGKPLYKAIASSSTLKLPDKVKLRSDVEYSWSVKAANTEIGSSTFKTLPDHSLELTGKRKPDAKAEFSDWLLYALTLKELGADQDANEVWSKLAADRPDLPELAVLAK